MSKYLGSDSLRDGTVDEADLTTALAATINGKAPAASPTFTGTVTAATINASGTVTAAAFAGPLTGNVTGNVSGSSGSCTGNAATATLATSATTASAVTGLSVTSGKTLTVAKTITLTSADDTSVATLPAGAKTLLAADGDGSSLINVRASTLPATVTGIVKSTAGAITAAAAGTDYLAPTGSGAALTALTAANITAGGTLPALNGSALTALNATNLASGTVADGRLPSALQAAARRRLLVESPGTELDPTVYLYRNFAATGTRGDLYEIFIPYADGRYSAYGFKAYSSLMQMSFLADAVPVVNTAATAATTTGTGWGVGTYAQPLAWSGAYQRSATAGDTIEASVTGHTLLLRGCALSNGGFGLVAIDGDYTAANMLPAVTQAEVDLSYFAAGDIGKRYIDCYGATLYDEFWPLAEGLTDAAHTVTVTVVGTHRTGSTDHRVYLSAFCGATAGTAPDTDATTSMAYVRYLYDGKVTTDARTAFGLVASYSPTGFTNYQFMGEYHGNATQVSATFRDADGAALTPANGAYEASSAVSLEIVSTWAHPDTGATVVAAKRMRYTSGRGGILHAAATLQWQNAGVVQSAYPGMLTAGNTTRYDTSTRIAVFDKALVGATAALDITDEDGSYKGISTSTDFAALYSSTFDTVAVLSSPRVDASVANWAYAGTRGLMAQDNTNHTDKLYITRVGTPTTEPVTAGAYWDAVWDYRIFRVPDAATVLEQ